MAVTWPACELLSRAAGPTAVHTWCDSGLVGSIVKMLKLLFTWSANCSPRPVPVTDFWNVSAQAGLPGADGCRTACCVVESFLISSRQTPLALWPAKAASGVCGLYGN